MRLRSTSIVSTNPLSQLVGRKQAIGLDNVALAVDPFGFNRVEPGTLSWGATKAECARLSLLS